MLKKEYSVAMSEDVRGLLEAHLLQSWEEDLCFALWTPSYGSSRTTALIQTLLFPIEGDRQQHGNVSFNLQYFDRVCSIALREGCGIAFLHSHPGRGWQGMSSDDIKAELKISGATFAITDLPLVGMTVGSDGIWSARAWEHKKEKIFERRWCKAVRTVGERLIVNFNDKEIPQPSFSELFKRTRTVWGEENHKNLARLKVGIVGLGSVGSMVAESLARMGLEYFVLIDFDEVQKHNLDRLSGATRQDIGRLKIDVAKRQMKKSSTAENISIATVQHSIAEEEGYKAALDCDVIFCCVDRPRPRSILNHFAYAHLIPVIDGGIQVRFKNGSFSGAEWQLQTVAPGRPCLECLKAYNAGDVSTEIEGKLDDPSYLKGLPDNHKFKQNENVFPFSANLASLEILQFIALATGIHGITNFGMQRYRYNPGIIDADTEVKCQPTCETLKLIGHGDRYFHLYGRDFGAEEARRRLHKERAKRVSK